MRGYVRKVFGEIGMCFEFKESEKFVKVGFVRDVEFFGLEFNLEVEIKVKFWLEWKERGLIFECLIRSRVFGLVEDFKKLIEERVMVMYFYEFIMFGEFFLEGNVYWVIEEEYGSIEREKLKRLVEIFEEVGVVVFSF